MKPTQLLDFMGVLEKLKCNTRHCYTSSGRKESVAEHSWRAAVMAYLMKDEFPKMDISRVMLMCLVHDFGEALTGDIPCFDKTRADEKVEDGAVERMLSMLPAHYESELKELFAEMEARKTEEAKLFQALDRLEAVAAHNESDLSTWIPLEYELNLSYGEENCTFSPYLLELRREMRRRSEQKIEKGRANKAGLPKET